MKCISKILLASIGFALAGAASADSHEGPSFRPLEIYACNFLDGKDADDLARVIARWNAWMDANDMPEYAAFVLTPIFHSAEITFDIAWVGLNPDGATMGAATELWLSKGGEMRAEFEKVVDCNVHTNFALLDIKAPAEEGDGAGPVSFTDCTAKEGREIDEAIDAIRGWTEHEAEHGIDAAHWVMFPAFGESSEADYDFKWVSAYPDYPAFGKYYDHFGTGGGWKVARDTYQRVMDCDSDRLYNGQRVRGPAE